MAIFRVPILNTDPLQSTLDYKKPQYKKRQRFGALFLIFIKKQKDNC